ncbi:MAG: hypothetical protein GY757_20170 [bacterium]|nr:hypothetical protein [bacterium]
MTRKIWDTPPKRTVGLFTDLRLFNEALEVAHVYEFISKERLTAELSARVKGLIFTKKLSNRVIADLIRELLEFNWIEGNPHNPSIWVLTDEGQEVLREYKKDRQRFMRKLCLKMHESYRIPGWFVNRLWELNPEGQGEIVIPVPPKDWTTISRQWQDNEWNDELTTQTVRAISFINKICPGCFPVAEDIWLKEVRTAWKRLSDRPPRLVARSRGEVKENEKGKMKTYTPRNRLLQSMKEAAVNLLFGLRNPLTQTSDFNSTKAPLTVRNYMAWCPRLAELGLIYYTDFHPRLPGRLMFPVSVFRKTTPDDSFHEVEGIANPDQERLFFHRPNVKKSVELYLDKLFTEYQRTYFDKKSLYVSIMDVRDEVCRQMRWSNELFDEFLEVVTQSNLEKFPYSISLESDIREDQSSGYQKLRRPVSVSGKLFSLLAMTRKKEHVPSKENKNE